MAVNRKYRDSNNQWDEEVCYVGIVAWSKLAESCMEKLHIGNAVLIDGELQSKKLHSEDGFSRSIVEIKAHRIQFLNKTEIKFEANGHDPAAEWSEQFVEEEVVKS